MCSVVVGEAALAALLKGVCGCATCADAERRVRDNAALGLAAVVRPAVALPSRPPVRATMWFLGFADRADEVVTTLRTGLYGLVVALSHFLFGCDTAGHTIITCGVATIKGKHQLQGGNHGNHLMRKYGGGLYSVWGECVWNCGWQRRWKRERQRSQQCTLQSSYSTTAWCTGMRFFHVFAEVIFSFQNNIQKNLYTSIKTKEKSTLLVARLPITTV